MTRKFWIGLAIVSVATALLPADVPLWFCSLVGVAYGLFAVGVGWIK